MKRVLLYRGVPVVLATIIILTVAPVAQGAVYTTAYYNIYYSNNTQLGWAEKLAPFLKRSVWAANTTIGEEFKLGRFKILFRDSSKSALGWAPWGGLTIVLNSRHFESYNKWGSVVAHETAHVLFGLFANGAGWSRSLTYERSFLTEALSFWAGDYVYYSKKYSTSSAYRVIRNSLMYYASKRGKDMSWYGAAYYYMNGSGDTFNHAYWQLHAIGWFLTGGRLTSSSPDVKKLLRTMNGYSNHSNRMNWSTRYSTARFYFEKSFKVAYGKYANAGWNFTGESEGAFNDKAYLYGIFWYKFYN